MGLYSAGFFKGDPIVFRIDGVNKIRRLQAKQNETKLKAKADVVLSKDDAVAIDDTKSIQKLETKTETIGTDPVTASKKKKSWTKFNLEKDDIPSTLRRSRSRSPRRTEDCRTYNNEKHVRETKLVLALERVRNQWRKQELAAGRSNHDKQDGMAHNQSKKIIVKRWRKTSNPTRLVFMDQSL